MKSIVAVFIVLFAFISQGYSQYSWEVKQAGLVGDTFYEFSDIAHTRDGMTTALGTIASTGFNSYHIIIRSADAGVTWKIDTLDIKQGHHHNIKLLTAIDSNLLYMTGDSGYFLKSTDGGKTFAYKKQLDTINFSAMCFIDSLTGMVTGPLGKIYLTTDGGGSFSERYLLSGFGIENCIGFTGGKYLVFDRKGRMYRSYDFGSTWDTIMAFEYRVSDTEQFIPSDICFKDSLEGFIVGTRAFSGSKGVYYFPWISRTLDGGNTWKTVVDTGSHAAFDLFSISFHDSKKGIAVGRVGFFKNCLVTSDGGETWTEEPMKVKPVNGWDYTSKVVAIDDKTVVAVTHGGGTNIIRGELTSNSVKQKPIFSSGVIAVYPNPVNEMLRLKLGVGEHYTIKVYNVLGQLVKSASYTNTDNTIDCSKLSAGTYYLDVTLSDGTSERSSFVKN